VATLFVRCRKTSANASQIAAAFAKHGVPIEVEKIRVPLFFDGPKAGKPRDFAIVGFINRTLAYTALKLIKINFDGETYFISEARPSHAGHCVVRKTSSTEPSSAIQPKGERFKAFDENDFRR